MPTCPALAAPEPTRYSLHVPLDFDAGLSKVGDYVIVDPAPDWVSPYWAVHSYGSDVSVGVDTMTLIFVLNPGIEPASVSVTFHEVGSAPGVFASLTQTISPRDTEEFAALPQENQVAVGWVSIASDQPVLPWGTIRAAGTGLQPSELMTFGRWSWGEIKPPHFVPV
jgi:hypothetical protein